MSYYNNVRASWSEESLEDEEHYPPRIKVMQTSKGTGRYYIKHL